MRRRTAGLSTLPDRNAIMWSDRQFAGTTSLPDATRIAAEVVYSAVALSFARVSRVCAMQTVPSHLSAHLRIYDSPDITIISDRPRRWSRRSFRIHDVSSARARSCPDRGGELPKGGGSPQGTDSSGASPVISARSPRGRGEQGAYEIVFHFITSQGGTHERAD